MKYVMKETMSS